MQTINGHAEVDWKLIITRRDGSVTDERFPEEAMARDEFDRATKWNDVRRAKLLMIIELEAATHSKT